MGCSKSIDVPKPVVTQAVSAVAASVVPAPPAATYKYILLGGGASAGYAAREFIKRGLLPKELCIVTEEPVVSYERPALSKAFLNPSGAPRLPGFHTCVGEGGERQTPEWYVEKGIDYKTGCRIESVDFAAKTLVSTSGEVLAYSDALILATGCRAITTQDMKMSNPNLANIHTIRSNADALALAAALEATKAKNGRVVIVGGGYLGLEVSAAVSGWGIPTTVVFPDERLMARVFDAKIGAVYAGFYESKGIELLSGVTVVGFKAAEDGRTVAGVELADGRVLPSDLVVVGVGARPVVDLYNGALATELGGIKVDGNFRTSLPGVYAIGDIASFPLLREGGKIVRQEHVTHCRRSAEHAVASLLDPTTPAYDYLPFFYSREFAFSWKLWGAQRGETVHFGEFEAGKTFGCYFVEGGRVVGAFLEGGAPEDADALKAAVLKGAAVADVAALGGEGGLAFARSLF